MKRLMMAAIGLALAGGAIAQAQPYPDRDRPATEAHERGVGEANGHEPGRNWRHHRRGHRVCVWRRYQHRRVCTWRRW
jgi:hypothetical protein